MTRANPWKNDKELDTFLAPDNTGLVFSPNHCLSLAESFQNLALVGASGSGKTRRYIIPNILRCSGSMVCTDIKGELFAKTSGHMKKRGYRVQVLQPSDLTQTLGFNPNFFSTNFRELRQLASTIVANSKSGGIWSVQAVDFLNLFLTALKNYPDPSYTHMGNVRELLTHFMLSRANPKHGEKINQFMSEYLKSDQLFSEYKAFLMQNDRMISDLYTTVSASLSCWTDPNVTRFTAFNTIDIEALRKEKTIIYLIIPEEWKNYFSPVINLFYTACFNYCIRTANEPDTEPVFFFLDEFGNLGQIPNFASIATTLRSSRCSLNIVLQDLNQLAETYGQYGAKNIFSGGMWNKLFLRGLDVDTCAHLEKVLGQNTEYDTIFGGVSDKARTVGKPLLAAHEIRMLERYEAILISGGQLPIKMHLPDLSEYPECKNAVKMKPAEINSDLTQESVKFLDLAPDSTSDTPDPEPHE